MMTSIIILNWNGWKDTLACLKSLYKISGNEFFIIIVDNGSTNNSVTHIVNWLKEENKNYHVIEEDTNIIPVKILNRDCIIYKLNENYGFAKGNNLAINIALKFSPTYFLLLNNDTEVEIDFLHKLILFINSHREYKVLTPMIKYYGDKERIWNCGGKLYMGFRKYYYLDALASDVLEKKFIPVSFITGCALFFSSNLLKENNYIFTEKFFFGEEDFNFCMRMKKKNIKMACVLDAHIYHKVSSSISTLDNLGRIYIYYLNRFIDMKLYWGNFYFFIWKYVYILYIAYFLKKTKKLSFSRVVNFIRTLLRESKVLLKVDKCIFEQYVKGNITF